MGDALETRLGNDNFAIQASSNSYVCSELRYCHADLA